jgi:hypothetical protein
MIPDPLEKTVLIPVKIVEGKVEFFYGGPLPVLKEGVVGDLRVPRYAVLDEAVLEKLEMGETVEIIPAGGRLGALINIKDSISDEIRKYLIEPKGIFDGQGQLIEIVLQEPLRLRLRGTKRGELCECRCTISALPGQEAISINQAYTLISIKYETHRRSHSGNVFEKVYCWGGNTEGWFKLAVLRDAEEAKFEQIILMKQSSTGK